MLRVEYKNSRGKVQWGPGALVLLPMASGDDVYWLAAPNRVLPSCALSFLRKVTLVGPAGEVTSAASGGIAREWVRRVWCDWDRGFTLVELTRPAVQAMRAARATCRTVATATQGMRVTRVYAGGAGALVETPATIACVADETLELTDRIRSSVLLIGEDGRLLGVTSGYSYSTLYSFEKIVNEFLEDRMWQIRCRPLAYL